MAYPWEQLRRDSIVHRRALQRAGWTNLGLKRALHDGRLERTRRDWFRLPGTTGDLERAAWVGARLSCITAAAHLGLWTFEDGKFHVAATRSSSRLRREARPGSSDAPLIIHWQDAVAPVGCETLVDPIENVLACVAACRPFDEAIVVFDSALNKRLITRNRLALIGDPGSRFAELAVAADGRADSGIESIPRVRLARRGIEMVPQVKLAGHSVDGLVGKRLALQFDGDRWHSSPADRERDRQHDAVLQLDQYTVLRFGTSAVLSTWQRTEDQIVAAVAEGLHLVRVASRR